MKIRNIFSLFLLINVFVLAAEESVLTIQENGKNHGLPEIITFSEPVKTGYFLPIYTADTLKLKNGVNAFADSLVNEAGSFSGISAKNIVEISFRIQIPSTGKYRVWYRGKIPVPGNWIHSEVFNGKRSTVQDATGASKANVWQWSKGPAVYMNAGKNCKLVFDWQGGILLDGIVILPESESPEQKKLPVFNPGKGEIVKEFRIEKPVHLLGWDLISFQSAGAAKIIAEYSINGGRTYKKFESGKKLALPARILRIRFRKTDAAWAMLNNLQFVLRKKNVPPVLLKNQNAEIAFDRATGAISGIKNLVSGKNYMLPNIQSPLFELTLVSGTEQKLPFREAKLVKITPVSEQILTMEHALLNGKIRVFSKFLLQDNGLLRYSMGITNNSGLMISGVRYPLLKSLRIGDNEKDDFLMQPVCTGSIVQHPAQFLVPRQLYNYAKLLYPGCASMCWTALYDKSGGLYLAVEDNRFRVTEFLFSACGKASSDKTESSSFAIGTINQYKRLPKGQYGDSIELGFFKRMEIASNGKNVKVPDFVVGVHAGNDWHWGAERYREWIRPILKKRPTPNWFLEDSGYVPIHMFHAGTDFSLLSKGYPYHSRITNIRRPPFSMVAVWCQQVGSSVNWAYQVPDPIFGTEDVLRNAVQLQHEEGIRMGFYVLPPMLDPTFKASRRRISYTPASWIPEEDFPADTLYRTAGERNMTGDLYHMENRHCEASMFPGDPKWQSFMRKVMQKYFGKIRAGGAYLDGLGLYTHECSNRNSKYQLGEWTLGMSGLISSFKNDALNMLGYEAILLGEGMSEVEHQHLDSAIFYWDNAPDVYRYVHPENVGNMFTHYTVQYNFVEKQFSLPARSTIYDLPVLYGLFFYGADNFFEMYRERFLQMKHFNSRLIPFRKGSRFYGELGLNYDRSAVLAKLYLRNDKSVDGAVAVIMNPKQQKGQSITIDKKYVFGAKYFWRLNENGTFTAIRPEKTANGYRFPIPEDKMSAVFALKKSEPFLFSQKPEPVVPGESGTFLCSVFNPCGDFNGKLTFELPEKWSALSLNLQLKNGEMKKFKIKIKTFAQTALNSYEISAKLGNMKTSRLIGMCSPVFAEVNRKAGNIWELTLKNRSARNIPGTVNITVPKDVKADRNQNSFVLKPGETKTWNYRLSGVEKLTRKYFLKADVRYEKYHSVAYETVQPPLLNGDFETDSAGDNRADYWECVKSESDPVLRTDERASSGTYSLKLGKKQKASHKFLKLVPGTRYRISGDIYRTKQNQGAHITIVPILMKNKNVCIGNVKNAELNKWQRFSAEFKTYHNEAKHDVYITNDGDSTVWFDNIKIEEVQEK